MRTGVSKDGNCEIRVKEEREREEAHSLGPHISAIVPPTIVEPVEPKDPWKNRAMRTVWIFLDL